MTWFDLVLILVLALSISFAAIRGAMREVATLLALAAAALIAFFSVKPLLAAIGADGSFFATIAVSVASVLILFAAFYFGLHVALKKVSLSAQMVRVDRAAGGVFGLARALILVGLAFLGYDYYQDESRRPDAINNALLLPVAKASASLFKGLGADIDPDPATLEATVEENAETNAATEGYDRGDRAGLREIVTTVTTSDTPEGSQPLAAEINEDEDPIADILVEEDDSEQ